VEETMACSCKHLDAIITTGESNNATVELALKERLTEVLVDVEKNDLAIATSDADLVVGDSFDLFDALGADTLAENEHLVLDLVGAEVS
jgi:hypothetical protein